MKTTPFMNGPWNWIPALVSGFLACLFLLSGCMGPKSRFNSSVYKFTREGESYRIRSVYSNDRSDRQNELIGPDFLATDFDQDGIIDHILLGNTALGEAQRIYDYGLEELARKSRLTLLSPPVDRYVIENSDTRFEIKSFKPPGLKPFNEFIVTNKRQLIPPATVVLVDRDADGALGTHVETRAAMILLVRSELVRRYPTLLIAVVPGAWMTGGTRSPSKDPASLMLPAFRGRIGAEVLYAGFSSPSMSFKHA